MNKELYIRFESMFGARTWCDSSLSQHSDIDLADALFCISLEMRRHNMKKQRHQPLLKLWRDLVDEAILVLDDNQGIVEWGLVHKPLLQIRLVLGNNGLYPS